MIKIVLYTENYFPGGLERFIFDILESKKFDIFIIVNDENTRIIEFAKKNNLKYSAIQLTDFKISKLKSNNIVNILIKIFNFLAYYIAMIPNYFKIRSVLLDLKDYNNFLIINGGYPAALSCFSAALAAKKVGFKKIGMSILSSPSSHYSHKIFRFFQSKIDNFVNKAIDFYIPNSNEIKIQLMKNININPEKIHVVYTGVPIPDNISKLTILSYDNICIKKNNNDFWIIMVGLLGSTKRQDLLLNAIATMDTNVRLLLVGDGPNRLALESMVRDLGLGDRVIFLGWVNPVNDVYRFADILVFLSNQEGLPYVVSEAMSYKLPIIASSVGGIPEQIKDNIGGLLVSNDNINTIKEKINYLKDRIEIREQFGLYSYERLQTYFSLDAMNNELLKLYK